MHRKTYFNELTKNFEQVVSSTLLELNRLLASGEIPCKGEFVLVLEGNRSPQHHDVDQLLLTLLSELAPSKAASMAAAITGQPRSGLYDRAMQLKDRGLQ